MDSKLSDISGRVAGRPRSGVPAASPGPSSTNNPVIADDPLPGEEFGEHNASSEEVDRPYRGVVCGVRPKKELGAD